MAERGTDQYAIAINVVAHQPRPVGIIACAGPAQIRLQLQWRTESGWINQWDRLARCFENGGRVTDQSGQELDAPVGTGERIGWTSAAPRPGGRSRPIASVVWRLCLPVAEYLLDVLPGLAGCPVSQVIQRTPASWRLNARSRNHQVSAGRLRWIGGNAQTGGPLKRSRVSFGPIGDNQFFREGSW